MDNSAAIKFEKQCQSCGMPLKNGEHAGTEADGSKSLMYCSLCYENGEFLGDATTVEGMQLKVDEVLKAKGWWRPMRWLAKKQIPSLKRWKAN